MKAEDTINLLSFDQALEKSEKYGGRHLLLGNGFSIACRSDIFRYERIFNQAKINDFSQEVLNVFDSMKTYDFEKVIRSLNDSALISGIYGLSTEAISRMKEDADKLKELLVKTIASSHPDRPSDISDCEFSQCQMFLSHFEKKYTLNYDLLLYWTQMHVRENDAITARDGFQSERHANGQVMESDYVIWDSSNSNSQNTWYLHGGLHLFDSPTVLKKYTWKRTGVRLIEQIQNALSQNCFPLFVSEGMSDEKLERIRHNDYLSKAYRSFQELRKCLFVYGHSLAESDEHILQLIQKGKIKHVFVGLYGDPNNGDNTRIIRRANNMKLFRSDNNPLLIDFYDSVTARVWRDQ